MPEHYVTSLAWEWFRVGQDHSAARLQDLVLEIADTYAVTDSTLEVVLRETKQKFVARYGLKNLLA